MTRLLVENVSKHFPTRAEPLVVLREVSFELGEGQNVAIVGPSGSGKSTLLNIIGALEPPSGGRVVLDGQDPAELDEPRLAAFRNRRIGFVFQDHHLLPQCSVLENVLVPTMPAGPTSSEAVRRAGMLLDRVGLQERLEYRPAELSGGERQRVALARALINQPKLLLGDEPTGNLDTARGREILELIGQFNKLGGTVVLVTHSELVTEFASRRLDLVDGRIVS